MLEKNGIYEGEIVDYTAEGQGVAKVEGCTVFVPNGIVGERCRLRLEKVRKTWAAGKIVEILDRSPHRVNRACPVSKLCGGCAFQHMDYQAELALKAERVRQALNRIGGEHLETVPITPADCREGYRNKAIYPVSAHKGRVFAGFFRAGTHHVVENDRCGLLPPEMDRVKETVVAHANRFGVSAYDETTGEGLVRYLFVRRGAVSGQILVCLAVNGNRYPRAGELIAALKEIPGFATLVLSVNRAPGNVVLGKETKVLYGPGTIEDTLCGLRFRLSPHSFYQVNHAQAQRLYGAAVAAADLKKTDTVLDLYCGVGTITLVLAQAAGKAIGVEVVPQAVADAEENARENHVENVEFFCADAGQAALELEERGLRPEVVLVDPPRKGLNAEAIEAIGRMSPSRIVYVSCDPATLARDTALLKQKGYALTSAQAFDLFPRCAHVESVVCLSRKQVSDYLHIAVNTADLETDAGRAYNNDDIKQYIADKYGFKVHSAYIGQVKAKLGIREHENYNDSHTSPRKPTACPEEKEAAIMDALKHFKRI